MAHPERNTLDQKTSEQQFTLTVVPRCSSSEIWTNNTRSAKSTLLSLSLIFNGHRDAATTLTDNWKFLIQLVYLKFQPRHLLIPKTIATSNNQSVKKIEKLNFALHNLIRSLNLPIISPHINRDFDHKIFARDGIHFSRFEKLVFSQILKFYFKNFTCNQIKQLTRQLSLHNVRQSNTLQHLPDPFTQSRSMVCDMWIGVHKMQRSLRCERLVQGLYLCTLPRTTAKQSLQLATH